jgi:hypothetical protein
MKTRRKSVEINTAAWKPRELWLDVASSWLQILFHQILSLRDVTLLRLTLVQMDTHVRSLFRVPMLLCKLPWTQNATEMSVVP